MILGKEGAGGIRGCEGADQDLEGQKVETAGVLEGSGHSHVTVQFNGADWRLGLRRHY